MIIGFFSVRDKLSGFGYPTPDLNDKTATRNFAVAVNNPQVNSMNFSPSDYDLYKVGSFDTEKGLFYPTESGQPEFIISGTNVFGINDRSVK